MYVSLITFLIRRKVPKNHLSAKNQYQLYLYNIISYLIVNVKKFFIFLVYLDFICIFVLLLITIHNN